MVLREPLVKLRSASRVAVSKYSGSTRTHFCSETCFFFFFGSLCSNMERIDERDYPRLCSVLKSKPR